MSMAVTDFRKRKKKGRKTEHNPVQQDVVKGKRFRVVRRLSRRFHSEAIARNEASDVFPLL